MATPTYTNQNLRDLLNGRIKGKRVKLVDVDNVLNSAVRIVKNDVDLRGAIRRSTLAPNLFDDIYSYTLPTDVDKFIDIIPQVKAERKPEWDFVTEEYFERNKEVRENLVAIGHDDQDRNLLLSRVVKDSRVTLGQLESPTGDGDTWAGFGTTNDSDIKADEDDFVSGNGAVRFQDDTADLAGTTVGIQNKGLDAVDLSKYLARGSVFVRGRLTTGDTNILQLNVRLGSDTSNYYTISDSTTNENVPFKTGWNLVRLDLSGKTATASPVDTAIDYAAIYWTKTAGQHINDTDYGFDLIVVAKGQIHDLLYYSRYLWQTSAGAYQENTSATTDRLNVFEDELELVLTKAAELAFLELSDENGWKQAQAMYGSVEDGKGMVGAYMRKHPSQAMILLESTYEFATVPINVRGEFSDTNLDS